MKKNFKVKRFIFFMMVWALSNESVFAQGSISPSMLPGKVSIVWGYLNSVCICFRSSKDGEYTQERMVARSLLGNIIGYTPKAVLAFTNIKTNKTNKVRVPVLHNEITFFQTQLQPGQYKLAISSPFSSENILADNLIDVSTKGNAIYIGDIYFAGIEDDLHMYTEDNLGAHLSHVFHLTHQSLKCSIVKNLCSTTIYQADLRHIGRFINCLSVTRATLRDIIFIYSEESHPIRAFSLMNSQLEAKISIVSKKTVGVDALGDCLSFRISDETNKWTQDNEIIATLKLPYCDSNSRPRMDVEFISTGTLEELFAIPACVIEFIFGSMYKKSCEVKGIEVRKIGESNDEVTLSNLRSNNAKRYRIIIDTSSQKNKASCFLVEYSPITNSCIAVIFIDKIIE